MNKKVQKKEILSVGIDISKDKNNVCFLFKNNNNLYDFEIENNINGFKKLELEFKKYVFGKNNIPVVLESTGSYHLPLCFYLYEKGYNVKLINPIITKKYTRSNIRKCKTDKTDARLLAKIGIIEKLETFKPDKKEIELKRKSKMLEKLTKERQSLSLSVKNYKDDFSKNKLKLGDSFKQVEKLLRQLEKTIKKLQKEIAEDGKVFKDFDKITDIKGVSDTSASIILSFIGNKSFKNKKSLVAYSGLDVSVKQSGTSIFGKGKISKRGNSLFRKTLTHVAWGLIMHNDYFKKIALKYKEKGKHYYEILVIIARKFLHIIYSMIKYNSLFSPV